MAPSQLVGDTYTLEVDDLTEDVMRGGLTIQKLDSQTGTTPQGDASLEGISFEIVNDSQNPVVVNGNTAAPGQVAMTITTNAAGVATTGENALPYCKKRTSPACSPTTPSKTTATYRNTTLRDVCPKFWSLDRAQEELAKRVSKRPASEKAKTPFGRYSGKYALSTLVVCGKCGALYRRITWHRRGKVKVVWRCGAHQDKAATCPDSPTIEEAALQSAVMEAISQQYIHKEETLEVTMQSIRLVLTPETADTAEREKSSPRQGPGRER